MPGNDGVSSLPNAAALDRLDDSPLVGASDNGRHRCSRCPAKFKRIEHLKRHQLGHTDQRRFVCPICSKRFTRSDILNRHVSVHRAQDSRDAGVRRACVECARVRERCTKATPCQRCYSKSIQCIYPIERPKNNRPGRKNVVSRSSKSGMEQPNQDNADQQSNNRNWPEETSDGRDASAAASQAPPSAALQQNWSSFNNEGSSIEPARRIDTDTAQFPRFPDAVRTRPAAPNAAAPGVTLDTRGYSNPGHQFPDSNLRGEGVPHSPLASEFPYNNSDCTILTMNAAPPLETTLTSPPQLSSVTLGYNPDGYDASFEFPLNWLPANESPDLDYSSIPRFGFNSPVLFEEPARIRILEDSNMASHSNEIGQPNADMEIQIRTDCPSQAQQIHRHQAIPTPDMTASTHSSHFVTNGNDWQRDDRSEISIPISTSSPSVTISATAQDSKKPGHTSSAIGGLYATSTNGARLPCTAREKRPSMIIFGATALPAVSHDVPILENDPKSAAFPSLDHISYSSLSAGVYCDRLRPETYDLIITRFRQLCLDCGNIYPAYLNSEFPSIDHLNFFTRLYFQHVNSVLPIYHDKVTDFNDNWLLALSICAVGCQYTETVEFSRCVKPMHEFLRRAIDMELQGEDLTRLELPLIQAMILSQLTMLYYGPRNLYQQARVRNGTMVELVHSMSLLSPTRPVKDTQRSDDSFLEERWKQWLEEEARRRLGYTIWLLDNMAVYHHGRRPLLSLECAQASLPDDRLWGARNSQEWNDIATECKQNPSLPSAVQDIFRQKTVKSDLGEYGRVILLHGVYHEVLRVKEYFKRPLSGWIPSAQKVDHDETDGGTISRAQGPDNRNALARWRNAALDCIDVLHWDANGTIAQLAGAEHSTVFHLHLSRVVLLAPYEQIRTLTLSIASMTQRQPYGRTPTRAEALDAEREVLEWAQRDEHKARLTMIHCGCLYWHMRRYSRKAFYEPVSILLATLVIWAYSCYTCREQSTIQRPNQRSQQHQNPRHPRDHPNGDSLLGDNVSREPSMEPGAGANTSPESTSTTSHLTISTVAEAAAAMSESSYPIPTSIQIDRPCDDEMVQLFVRSGRPSTMRAYITGVGDILGPKAPAAILSEGRKILCAVSAAWGRTAEHVALLDALEQAMVERTNEGCQAFSDGSR